MRSLRGILLPVTVLCLVACASAPPRAPISDDQLKRLEALQSWSLTARLGLSDGEQSGSGRLDWSQAPTQTRMNFVGALGRGAWRLSVDPGVAVLELPEDRFEGHDVNDLLAQTVGWELPVTALVWWVRGLPSPDGPFRAEQAADDRLQRLEQFGWAIEYDAYRQAGDLLLPRKLTATRGEHTVKMVVRRWTLPSV